MSDIWTIRKVLTWTTGHFEKRGVDSPRLTAEVLLAFVLKTGRVRLYVDLDRPLSKEELGAFRRLWSDLARGVTTRLVATSLGLIMGGAASNAIDRLTLGGVADFFSLHAYGFYWYVFNIADVAIVAGVVGLIYDSLGPSRKDASKGI